MKLFVINKITKQKEYLGVLAPTRIALTTLIGSPWFNIHGNIYHVNEVVAESQSNNTAAGAVVGGLIGLLGGPLGVLIGGALGGALGNENDKTETTGVNNFNNSRI